MKDILYHLRFLVLLSVASFFALLFAMAVRGDFREPAITAGHESWPPMNVSSTYQKKFGSSIIAEGGGGIGAWDFYLPNQSRWLSQGPVIQIKEGPGVVYCDRGYMVAACSGTRHADLVDSCGDEGECGFVGAMPINSEGDVVFFSTTRKDFGPRWRNTAAGCQAAADGLGVLMVHAYCMKRL